MKIEDYGYMPNETLEESQGIPARVIAVHKERCELICEYGEVFGRLKTKEYFIEGEELPTTGDFVLINYNKSGDSQIMKTLPRRTFFSRSNPTPGRGVQIVAANFDYVFIMQSMNHDFNERRLERYLILAWQSGANPVIVLTKSDIVNECEKYTQRASRIALGVPVYAVSANTGEGLVELEKYIMPKKTIVFLGSSGVGKSSLVNALAGEKIMEVNDIREDDSKGRHTTTHRQLIMLKNGAMIIDTPGMRELGMWDVSEGIGEAFLDVEKFLGKCRFRDCNHKKEPGCAIKEAIKSGELQKERWDSYSNLKKEARYAEDKTSFLKEKQEWHKTVAKINRQKVRNKFNKEI